MPVKLGSTASALALCLAIAVPARAANQAAQDLKSRTDDLIGQIESASGGLVTWQGADRLDIRDDGDAAIADIANARISIGSEKIGMDRVPVSFDHIVVHYATAPEGAVSLSVVLPPQSILNTNDGGEIKLTLLDATMKAVLDAKSGRARESSMTFAGARIADKKSDDWVAFGPLSFSYKLVGAGDGGWTAPMDFTLKQIEFSFTEGPVDGTIDRIGYQARSAGPDLAALNRLRDRLEALRQMGDSKPPAHLNALLDVLPTIPSLFSVAKGELAIEGVTARPPKGEPYVKIATLSIGSALTGLSGDAAALRITVQHTGLALPPAILDAGKVPQRAVIDLGLEDVATGPLRAILEAAVKIRPDAGEAEKAEAVQQMAAAAMNLTPVLRIYDLAVDTPDAGIEATAEAKGSPLSAKGLTAQGDVAVRGFDTVLDLAAGAPFAPYLPVLKEIGASGAGANGVPLVKFHLVSAPPKWLTVNGNEVLSAWGFLGGDPAPDQPRVLRPAEPAMTGADVGAVQRALAAAKIAAPQNGAYDGATAAAVARFQKQNALNVDGVVTMATRQKLGIKPEPLPPPAQKKGAN
jgi:Putative peptidoglycan binding domain